MENEYPLTALHNGISMPNVGKNVRLLRQRMGLTLKELAVASGMDFSNLSKLERGEVQLTTGTIARLAVALGVPDAHLFAEESIEQVVEMSARRTPVLSPDQAPRWVPAAKRINLPPAQSFVLLDLKNGPNSFAFVVHDDSMAKLFTAGDLVIVDPEIPPRPGDVVLATINNGSACLRQYAIKGVDAYENEIIELIPMNRFYPSISSETKDIRIIGTMTEHRRFRHSN